MAEPKPTFAELLAQYEESRPKALDERFTQPVSPEAGPFQQIIPEEETYRDMAERTLAGALGDDRQAFRRAGKLLDTADQLPILGDASAGIDVIQAIKDVDPVGIGIGALGMIPGVNRAAVREALDEKIRNVRNFFGGQTPDQPEIDVRQLNTVSKPMSERLIRAQYMGFDTTKPYYHGTSTRRKKGIEKFESRHGSFFSESPDVAATYAVGTEGPSTYPVFLNKTEYIRFRPAKKDIESSSYGAKTSEGFVEKGEAGTPFYYYNRIPRAGMLVDLPDGTTRKLSDVFPKLKPSLLAGGRITNTDELAKAAKKAGYKGIIIEDILDIGAGTTMPVNPKNLLEANEVVVAIDPTTIRSVNAEFDPAAKDSAEILKSKGGMVTNMNQFYQDSEIKNFENGGGVDATAFAKKENQRFQTADEKFNRARFGSSTENEISQLKTTLKNQSINKIYNTAGSLGVRLPRGLGRDSAVDVFVNELLFRASIPIIKRDKTLLVEKELPKGGRLDLHFNPKQKSGGITVSKRFNDGGSVMNRPVMSRGLSNLIRNYSQGPLARLDVPRGTVPMQTMNGGGPVGGKYGKYNPFSGDDPLQELNKVQKKLISDDLLQMDDLGYGRPENNEFLYLGDTSTETSGNVPNVTTVTQTQGTSGPGDTSPFEDSPGGPPINTGNQFVASDPTVPYTMPEVVVEETTEQETTTTQPTTQTTTTQPATQQTTTTQPSTQVTQPTTILPVRTDEQIAADQAAEAAAAAEAERIRLANLAGQQQLAAEQLAAQQQVTQDNVVPVLGEEPTAAQTLDQALAQELADQATTQLAAQQNLDTQVLAAEQLVDQQAADRALLEAQLANQDDPTAVFQAPAPDTVDRGSFGVPPAISTQAVDPNAPNFLVADMIDDYTSGYAPTLGMDIKETVYPYQGMTEQEMQDQGVYRGQVFQPMPKLSFGSGTQESEGEEGEGTEQTATGYPRLNFGSTTSGSGTKGRYVTLPTGQSVFVPDYGDISFNTENPESEPGQYGLRDEQRYQCPAYYTLAFEGGQPYCKKIDKSQWPAGGRRRVQVANLPSRTAVSIIEPKEPGAETGEGYAQGGPVQNFNYGGPAQFQGPFGQALFQRFGQYQLPEQQRMPQPFTPRPMPQGPQPGFLGGGNDRFMPMMSSADIGLNGRPSVDNTGKFMDNVTGEIVDQRARGDIRTRGPESFGQMGPPQQIGQVAEPNTQQLASQLQNVTQQVNQLSSHLGVGGGGMSQGPSQLNQLQGGIGGLIQNLRPGPPPPQLRATGPVRPPMLQMLR